MGYLDSTTSALPQPPIVKEAVALEFELISFSRTVEKLNAAKHGGISFTSYRCAKHVTCAVCYVCAVPCRSSQTHLPAPLTGCMLPSGRPSASPATSEQAHSAAPAYFKEIVLPLHTVVGSI